MTAKCDSMPSWLNEKLLVECEAQCTSTSSGRPSACGARAREVAAARARRAPL